MKVLVLSLFVASALAFDACQVCENVLTPILNKATPDDRQKVISVLQSLCFGQQACLDKVNQISGDITGATPESLCTLVQLCKSEPVSTPAPQVQKVNFDLCSMCESAVDSIKSKVDNETVAQIKAKLEVLCFGNQACIAKIDSIAEQINSISSQEVCTDLKLCSQGRLFKYNGQIFCNLCEKTVAQYLDKYLNNDTIAQLESALDQACRGNQKCLDAVDKLVAQLSDVTPESVCEAARLCSPNAWEYTDLYSSDRCSACQQKLESVFSDANIDKFAASISQICKGIDACTTELQNVVNQLKANREAYITKACTLARQC